MVKACARRGRRVPTLAVASLLLASAGCAAEPPEGQRSLETPTQHAPAPATATATATSSGSPHPSTPTSAPPSASSAVTPTGSTADATSRAARARLVHGFPTDLIPVMGDSHVKASSIDRDDRLVVVSLIADSDASERDILSYYTGVLKKRGFESIATTRESGVASRTFSRQQGAESISVLVTTGQESRTFTIGANLRPETLK